MQPPGTIEGQTTGHVAANVAVAEASRAEDGRTAAAMVAEAETRFHTRDLLGAELMAKNAIKAGKAPRAYYVLGLALLGQQKYAAAADAFAEAIRIEPDNPDAIRNLELARQASRSPR